MFRVLFAPAAKNDLQAIYNYYENTIKGLGERFLKVTDERLERLVLTPLASELRYENVRCTLIKKFPYLIHYTVNQIQESVIVLRIFHTAQKPIWDE